MSFTEVSSSEITAVSPPGVAGVVDVRVQVPGALESAPSSGSEFTYEAAPVEAPVVSEVLPLSGPVAGGTEVTIRGANLTGATAVSFGDVRLRRSRWCRRRRSLRCRLRVLLVWLMWS